MQPLESLTSEPIQGAGSLLWAALLAPRLELFGEALPTDEPQPEPTGDVAGDPESKEAS